MYEAFDGTVFKTQHECENHDKKVIDDQKIAAFLSSKNNIYDKPAHLTVADNTLNAFCAFVRMEENKNRATIDKSEEEV